ncbi:MAG: hypothetical protein D6739_06720 [Nitrospirae bacterium]|nr:MAG: hypothetical protein D6739_06720 [Nitrospirota bacterium]
MAAPRRTLAMRLLATLGLVATLAAAPAQAGYIFLGSSPEPGYGAWAFAEADTPANTLGGRGTPSVNLSGSTQPDPVWGVEGTATESHAAAGHGAWISGLNPNGIAEEMMVYRIVSDSLAPGTPVEVRVSWQGSASAGANGFFTARVDAYRSYCPPTDWCDPGRGGHMGFYVDNIYTNNLGADYAGASDTAFSASQVGIFQLWVGHEFALDNYLSFSGAGSRAAQSLYSVSSRTPGARVVPVADIAVPEPASALLVAPLLAGLGLRRGRR